MMTLPSEIHFMPTDPYDHNVQESLNKFSTDEGTDQRSALNNETLKKNKNRTNEKKGNDELDSSSLHSSDQETIFQLQLQLESMRQKFKMSDDSIDPQSEITITTFDSTTKEGDEEALSQIELNLKISVLNKTNETLENENKKIAGQLQMRESEVNALAKRCASQEKKIMSQRNAKLLEKEISQLTEDLKRNEITIGELSEKLKATDEGKILALEEVEKVKTLNFKELSDVQKSVKHLEQTNISLKTEAAELKIENKSKDIQLKERQNEIISFTNSRLDQEGKLESIRTQTELIISTHEKAKKDSIKKVAELKEELTEVKACSKKEVAAFQEKLTNHQEAAIKQENIIDQQKGQLVSIRLDLDNKRGLLDEALEQKNHLEQDLEKNLTLVKDFREDSKLHLQEKEELKSKCSKLQNAFKEGEKSVKIMETEVKDIKKKLQNNSELEKNNLILKDKIERQENYLKKKLQQDRQRKLSSLSLPIALSGSKVSAVTRLGNKGQRNH